MLSATQRGRGEERLVANMEVLRMFPKQGVVASSNLELE